MNPWLNIWIRPRRTMRYIFDTSPHDYVILLAALAGIVKALERSFEQENIYDFGFGFVLFLIFIIGPVGGIVSLYVMGVILTIGGDLLGGKAESHEIRAVVAWSSIPQIAAVFLIMPQIFLEGPEAFASVTPVFDMRVASDPQFTLLVTATYSAIFVLTIIFAIYSLLIYFIGLSEAHRFSIWKSIFASIIGFSIAIIPLILLFLGLDWLR